VQAVNEDVSPTVFVAIRPRRAKQTLGRLADFLATMWSLVSNEQVRNEQPISEKEKQYKSIPRFGMVADRFGVSWLILAMRSGKIY
jgi:hypothetical protein